MADAAAKLVSPSLPLTEAQSALVDRLVEKFVARMGSKDPVSVRRLVEVAILTRGIAALEESLK